MKIVVDMNLSPRWCDTLSAAGLSALHWSTVGDARSADRDIMAWATKNGAVVFTHDLDFGIVLALTGSIGPSVIQMRVQDVSPEFMGRAVIEAIKQFSEAIAAGAIVVVDAGRSRATALPLKASRQAGE